MRHAFTVLLLVSCARTTPAKEVDPALIKPAVDKARLRTDAVGEGKWAQESAFVLIDAENTSSEEAVVTLAGELTGADKSVLGKLSAQSLRIPAGATRMFALVDAEKKPRPGATSVRVVVRSATVPTTPYPAHIDDLHVYPDSGNTDRVVAQAWLINDAERTGQVAVIAAFHDKAGRPLTRPFRVVMLGPKKDTSDPSFAGRCPDVGDMLPDNRGQRQPTGHRCALQFIGPPGSVRGTIFIGDLMY